MYRAGVGRVEPPRRRSRANRLARQRRARRPLSKLQTPILLRFSPRVRPTSQFLLLVLLLILLLLLPFPPPISSFSSSLSYPLSSLSTISFINWRWGLTPLEGGARAAPLQQTSPPISRRAPRPRRAAWPACPPGPRAPRRGRSSPAARQNYRGLFKELIR